jgi:phosphoglycerol transferase
MLVKGVLEHGWWFSNPHLGAPFGQQLYDFAVGGDNLHIALIWLLGLFSSSPAVVGNLFYLAAFPLAGAGAFAVLRWAGCTTRSSLVGALLYALVPYRFLRGEHHAFLAADFGVPLAVYLSLAVLEGRELFGGSLRARRTLLTLGACVVVGATGSFYYGTFAILLLVAAGALAALRNGWRALRAPAACALVILAVFAIDLAPTLAYRWQHGSNGAVGGRLASESELYGFKLAQLLLPVPGERIGPLARLEQRYASTVNVPPYNESFSGSLGLIGSVGFVCLLLAVLAAAAAGAIGSSEGRAPPLIGRLAPPGALALVAFLLGTVGGLGSLIAYVVTPQLRGWNRISPFVAFLSLLAVARLLDGARERLVGRRIALAAVPLAVLAIGLFDQTSAKLVPTYAASSARWSADRAFVSRVESLMPAGAKIFELPYEPFPEGTPVRRMGEYDLLRGYLHDSRLRWSFGATKGRPADFAAALSTQPPALILPAIATAGFDGLWIDTAGLAPNPAPVIAAIARTLGTSALSGGQGDLVFFDLRPYAARLQTLNGAAAIQAARDAVLRPLVLAGPGTIGPAPMFGQASIQLAVRNPRPRPATARFTVNAAVPAGAPLSIGSPTGSKTLAGVRARTGRVYSYQTTLEIPPGSSHILLRAPSSTNIVPFTATLTDPALIALAPPAQAR